MVRPLAGYSNASIDSTKGTGFEYMAMHWSRWFLCSLWQECLEIRASPQTNMVVSSLSWIHYGVSWDRGHQIKDGGSPQLSNLEIMIKPKPLLYPVPGEALQVAAGLKLDVLAAKLRIIYMNCHHESHCCTLELLCSWKSVDQMRMLNLHQVQHVLLKMCHLIPECQDSQDLARMQEELWALNLDLSCSWSLHIKNDMCWSSTWW